MSVRLIWPFRAVNQELGIDADAVWRVEGFGPEYLSDPEARLPWEVTQRLLSWSVEASGMSDLGLRAAEHVEPGLLDLVEYAARSQSTLRAGIVCFQRLLPILSDSSKLMLHEAAEASFLTLSVPASVTMHPASVDFTFAYLILHARQHTGVSTLSPREVHFAHDRPTDLAHHEALFGSRLRFGMSDNRIVLSKEHLELPLRYADSKLGELLDRLAQPLLKQASPNPSVVERARTLVAERIGSGRLSVKEVARALGMAPRTLHRRLADEKTTFRDVVDDVRRQLALAYLEEGRLPISEVAYLVGFSGVPAFHRAFKRWTNETPGKYAVRL